MSSVLIMLICMVVVGVFVYKFVKIIIDNLKK